MANHASHAALPYPIKGARFTVPVPYLDADGDPTDPTTPDTEISKDGGAYADCAEEVSTITGSNGSGWLTLSGAETDCSFAFLAAKVASGPKNTLMTLYPRVLPVVFSGTASAGAAGTITVATDVPAITNLLSGCIIKTTGGTGGGGTGGANNQARVITAMNSSRVCTVVPDWETNPSSDTTYEILLTEASILRFSDLKLIGGDAQSATDLKDFADAGYDPSTNKVQGVVLVDTITTYTGDTPQTGDSFAIVDSGTHGNSALKTLIDTIDNFVDTEIAAILAAVDTEVASIITTLGTAGDGLTNVPWNATWDAEVQSEVTDAIVAANLDHLISASGTADSGSTTTMVDAARTEGDADYWKGQIIHFTSTDLAGQCAIITDFDPDTDTFTFAPPLTQDVVNHTYSILPNVSVWDDTLAEHLISGSTGAALNAAGSAGDPWNTALPGAYGAGSAGFIVGTNLDATVSSRATQTSVNTIDDFLDTEVAAILAAVDTEVASIVTTVGTINTNIGTPSNLGGGATISFNLSDIESQTDDIGVAGAGLTVITDALTVIDNFLDTEIAAILAAVDTEIATIITTLGAAGAGLTAIPWNATWDTEVEDAVWDATLASHLDAGSTGAGLNAAGAAGDPWSTAIPGAYGAGSAGYIVGNNLDATVSSRASFVLRTTVASVTSQTDLVLTESSAENNVYAGCVVLIRDNIQPLNFIQGLVESNTDVSLIFTPTHTPGFTIAAGDIVEILEPAFTELDRDTLDGVASGTGNNVNLVSINGETIPVDNMEAFFTNGYGPLILRTTVASVTTQTDLVPTLASAENNVYKGCVILIRDNIQPLNFHQGLVESSTDVSIQFEPVVSAGFTIAAGDIIEILEPSFTSLDRTSLQNAEEDLAGGSGGGVLSARIGYSSLTPDHYLEIIQGEEKVITFIVEADGRFANAQAGTITVALRDPEDNEVEIEDDDVTRIAEELDVQIIRVTLSPENTTLLTEGLLRVEIAFDNQKAQLTHALKIIEGILG